jgi:hypothetical protein
MGLPTAWHTAFEGLRLHIPHSGRGLDSTPRASGLQEVECLNLLWARGTPHRKVLSRRPSRAIKPRQVLHYLRKRGRHQVVARVTLWFG